MRRLAEQGYGVMIVSHNLNDVFEVADRHRRPAPGPDGRTGPGVAVDRQSVVELMTTGTVGGKPFVAAPTTGSAGVQP